MLATVTLTQTSKLAIWAVLFPGRIGTTWLFHNLSNDLSTFINSDVWKIQKNPTIKICNTAKTITNATNYKNKANIKYFLNLFMLQIHTHLDRRLLSSAAPNIPKAAHNDTITPKPSMIKAAVSKSNCTRI